MPFIFRAGVWKPRTSPHTFQGAGEQALAWLQEVQRTYGVPVATEVATPEHVEAAMKAHIDYIWIGARTSANPIAVQNIAESLSFQAFNPYGIFIKNPVNADAQLWLGNIERLEKTGVPVIAIHRGCNHQPCWRIAHEVRLARPDVPMLLDPSHMSGDAAQVPTLMTKIDELGLNGAMVEVHHKPSEALSDAKQQITPAAISDFLFRFAQTINRERFFRFQISDLKDTELNWLRAEIDELDDALWETIYQRMEVSQRIGKWKKAHGVAPLQPQRFQQILTQREAWAKEKGLPEHFVKQLFDIIHEQSLREQE